MNLSAWLVPLVLCFMLSVDSGKKMHRSMSGSAARGAGSASLDVVPDLSLRLKKWRTVRMSFQSAGLSAREVKMVEQLVDASRHVEEIYWRQSDPDGLTLYQSLRPSAHPRDVHLRRYIWINGSRLDLLDENRPFIGGISASKGHGFYPQGLTREQVEAYVQQHPEKKAAIYSPTTVLRWNGKELDALPYHIAYRSFLEPAARDLREAAELSADPAFANFLRLRADALLTDDYFKSDLAWLELKGPKFDLIFAPYETYLDGLLGVKGSYGAAVLIRNAAESRKLELFEKYVADIQDALPLAPEDRPSKHGLETPMEVMDSPYRAGDLRHGYQAVADNLPNDPRVHEQKGSKKIFFKNFMDARVNYVILPLAKVVMQPDQASKLTGEGYLLTTIMHEIAHGLGPAFARTGSGKTDIREAIGPRFSALEEAKADAVGMFALKWLTEHNALPASRMEEFYASYVGDLFRTARFGTGEAHSQAEMMEFNYLSQQGAIQREGSGKYAINFAKMPDGVASLAKELLEIEATGDRPRAEAWFQKYGTTPPELELSLMKASGVPVDIEPIFSFKDDVK